VVPLEKITEFDILICIFENFVSNKDIDGA